MEILICAHDIRFCLSLFSSHRVCVCVILCVHAVFHTLQVVLWKKIYDGGCLVFLSLQGRKSCEIRVSNKRKQRAVLQLHK